jgi:hypothetical protein
MVCPRCGETGLHATSDECLVKLRRIADGERAMVVTWHRTPNDADLLTLVAILMDVYEYPYHWTFRRAD